MIVSDYGENLLGRDFVVGDLHGCVSRLEEALRSVSFNTNTDRLFSVGDLVDRGPESSRVMALFDAPWFHAVRGNHEQMGIDYAVGLADARTYAANGGSWFMRLEARDRMRFAVAYEFLPIAIEVEVAGHRVGIVHADVPARSWRVFRGELQARSENAWTGALWGRGRHNTRNMDGVEDIDLVIVGHSPVPQVTSLGNVMFIDTGAVFGGALTLLDLSQAVAGLPVPSR